MRLPLAFLGLLLISPWVATYARLFLNVADAIAKVNGLEGGRW